MEGPEESAQQKIKQDIQATRRYNEMEGHRSKRELFHSHYVTDELSIKVRMRL
jgi:hypothetical protein